MLSHPLPLAGRFCASRRVTFITLLFALMFVTSLLRTQGQSSPTPDDRFWIANGPINAIIATNNTVYIGGDFSYVGPPTGPMAVFDAGTGNLLTGRLRVAGQVKAVVSDGSGGWFIGGTFTNVAGTSITNLAHVDAHLVLDNRFNAKLTGSAVNALLIDGSRLYIGGSFTRVGGVANSGGLFGLSTSDASLQWNPVLSGTVNALVLNSGLIYAGGSFFSVGSTNVSNLAAISTNATALATAWNPAPDSSVLALQVSGTNIYVGGQFANIGTKARNRLAAISLVTGIAGTWNPNPNGIVRALWLTSTNAYVGGDFTTISVANKRGFASIGLTGTGTAAPLDLQIQSATTTTLVRSILLAGNIVYVGGQFTNTLGVQSALLVSVDPTTGLAGPAPIGTDLNGAAGAAFGINALAAAGNAIAAGGDFESIGGAPRHEAAALSLSSGAALPWAPNFSGPVLSMALGTNALYVGGSFTNLNGTNAQGLVAVDYSLGNALPFTFRGTNAGSPFNVNSLQSATNGLYVGGSFTAVGTQNRRFLALVDSVTGNLNSTFDAKLGGGFVGVDAMVLTGTNLFIGGDFSSVNAIAQPRLADVSPVDGTGVTSWVPAPNQQVTALAASADTLYVGGTFTLINGITLRNFAAFSLADRSLLPIDVALPSAAGGVTALGASTTVVFLGGSFTAAGGENRLNLGSISPLDATAFDWNPSIDLPPTVIDLTDNFAFVGGQFRFVGGQPYGFFAAFSRAPAFLSATQFDPATLQFTTSTGDRTDVVIQWTTNLKNGIWTNIATNSPGFAWTFQLPITGTTGFLRAVAR
jgi:trimeric autotransporter adhesin